MVSTTITVNEELIQAAHITKLFPLPEGSGTFTVLQDIDLTVHRNEIVALLGRSGSGKTTLLRIMAGLIQPDSGEVLNKGKQLRGHNLDAAMVFQNFALLPWDTVQAECGAGFESAGSLKRRACCKSHSGD